MKVIGKLRELTVEEFFSFEEEEKIRDAIKASVIKEIANAYIDFPSAAVDKLAASSMKELLAQELKETCFDLLIHKKQAVIELDIFGAKLQSSLAELVDNFFLYRGEETMDDDSRGEAIALADSLEKLGKSIRKTVENRKREKERGQRT